jgi:RNA polymerase sigma factor (sigma-70 family)
MSAHQDQQYIDALLENDTSLINELYHKYAGKIKAMVLKNSGTEADAADIFQEALVSLYQRANREPFVLTCPLDAYLYLICKNKWINELNKKANKGVTFIDTEGFQIKDDIFNEVEIVHIQYERRNLLIQKLKDLGDSCRAVLELSWSGLCMEEVASKLGNTYGYVRKKKSECMAKLIALVKTSPQFETLQW